MRVLVCCVPQAGHFTPMAPLLRALVDGGDEVLVAGGPWLQEPGEALGARYARAGSSLDDWFDRLRERTRGMPGDGLPPERIEHYFVPRLFAEIAADDMVEDLLDLGTQLAPDLLIHDAEAFAGPLVADLLGCRSVHHLFGPMLAPDVLALASDAVSPLWRSYDRTVPPAAGMYRDRTVAICPPSLEQHDPPAGELLRLRPTPLPTSPPRPEPTPLVYVTFGTLWANPELLSTVLRALADEPVQVVATSGRLHPSDISNVPENAQVEQFVPQQELLPRCSVVVHHAGAGTMFGALAHGLPQVALPQAADNFVNAELLASAGVGRTLLPHEVSPRSVRDAVRDVLTNRPYRAQARQVADEIADMPGAEQVAQQLRG